MSSIKRLITWAACVPVAVLNARPEFDGRTQQQPVPVTGMTTGFDNRTGQYPARWEVNALQEEGGPRWDLYIQALVALQNRTETDELSHFGISGIHGMPYAPYNGVGPVPGGSGAGFCPHGESQFVAWHRPYVALYEQILGAQVQRIAASYNSSQNSSAYREAGEIFRLPYWDWAANPQLPPSCTQENITINGPRGPLTLRSPLYNYRFSGSRKGWPTETTRASDGKSNSNPDVVNANLAAVADQLKYQVYRTFTYAETYDQMSSTANLAGVSLEASHNIVHNAVGGTFASLDLTAFDALFMLHHANLDRLAALWAALHPGAACQSEWYASPGLYSTARGENITASSPTKPFYQADKRSFHTGITAASLKPFGYTYPELNDIGRIIPRINELYGDTGLLSGCGKGGGEKRDWFVQITVNRSDLDLPCNIDVVSGDMFAGRMALLNMPKEGLAHATIPLQKVVATLGSNTTGIEATLREWIRVEVREVNGSTIDISNITNLNVYLVAIDVTPRRNESEFPKYRSRSMYTKTVLDRGRSDNG